MASDGKNPKKRGSTSEIDVELKKAKTRPKRKAANNPTIKSQKQVSTNIHHKLESESTKSASILTYLNGVSHGDVLKPVIKDLKIRCIINQISQFKWLAMATPFQKRVTCITWHPIYSDIVVAGSKFGELALYKMSSPCSSSSFIEGTGPGGSIVGLKFKPDNSNIVFTSSITGKISEVHLLTKATKTLQSTGTWENWYSSLDVSFERKMILSGDTRGNVLLLSNDGKKVWNQKLHKSKISHVEFSLADPNLFVTASIDHTAKLFDVRMASKEPFKTFNHVKGVNSAHFSSSNRHCLLTTDQHSEIKVYKSAVWNEELIIKHPHRQFQHLTPIKAVWHPIEDIIIVGRYPDDNFLKPDVRTIDFYDGGSGKLLYRMNPYTSLISSLVAMNNSGDALISSSGSSLCFFKDANVFDSYKKFCSPCECDLHSQ